MTAPEACRRCHRPLGRHFARGLHKDCYRAAERLDQLADFEPLQRRAADVLDDLAVLRIRQPDITYREAAAQLGMTRGALVQAVVRDRRRQRAANQSTRECAA